MQDKLIVEVVPDSVFDAGDELIQMQLKDSDELVASVVKEAWEATEEIEETRKAYKFMSELDYRLWAIIHLTNRPIVSTVIEGIDTACLLNQARVLYMLSGFVRWREICLRRIAS